jgi:hypothetical protein
MEEAAERSFGRDMVTEPDAFHNCFAPDAPTVLM